MVDNTFASPYLCNPIAPARTCASAAHKFIGGHGNSIGGIIVDSGSFRGRTISLNHEPSVMYHGMARRPSSHPIIKARVEGLRDLGPCLSPFNAFLFLQGIETLGPRMERHVANALAVAKHLEGHPGVTWVNYPSLPSSPYYALAQKYLPKGASSVFTFGIKGGFDAGVKFINSLKMFSHVANVGDTRSLVIHPASTTHQQLGAAEQKAAGVEPDMVRLCIGIEDLEDILWDLDQALSAVNG